MSNKKVLRTKRRNRQITTVGECNTLCSVTDKISRQQTTKDVKD